MASFLAAHHGNCKDDQTTGHATELPRLRKSCDYCVRMKRGCDGGTPCELCRRRNKHCIRSLKKRSGPAKGAKYRKRGNHHLALPRSNVEPVTKAAAAAAATSSMTKSHTRAPCRPTPDQGSFMRERCCGSAGSKALVSGPTHARYLKGEPAALEKYSRASIPVSPGRVLSQPPRQTSQLVTPIMSKKSKEDKKQEVSSSAFGVSLQSSWRGAYLDETVWDCRSVSHDVVGTRGNVLPSSYLADGAARTGPDTVPGDLRVTGEGPSMFGSGGGDWNGSVEVAEWRRGSLEEVLLGSYCKRSNSSGKSQVYMSANTRAPEHPQFVPSLTVTSSMRSGPENLSGVGLADLQTTVLPPKENRLGSWESGPNPSLGELLLGEATTCGLC